MAQRLISADAVVTMQGDAVWHQGGVVVDEDTGLIVAAGDAADLQGLGGIEREHFPGVMLPGLVNAHTHLELGYQRCGAAAPGHFTQWVAALMKNYPPPGELEAAVIRAVRSGVAESLAAGVTAIGDISRHCQITRRELTGGPLRAISFGEIVGLGKMRRRLEPLLEAAADGTFASASLTIGLSPHAPYTVEGPALAAITKRAASHGMPMAMHLAELSEERDFLRDLSGPLGRDWDVMRRMDILDAAIPVFAGGPLKWAKQWGLLGAAGAARRVPVVLAHVNHAVDEEITLLAESRASVAYCPRTHGYFGHPPHRYRAMLAAGVNVCLGTDSLASNPDLSVLNEARLLHLRDGLPAPAAMEMITWRGARALGIDAGRLAAGRRADMIILSGDGRGGASAEAILGRVLAEAPPAAAVWIGGRRVV